MGEKSNADRPTRLPRVAVIALTLAGLAITVFAARELAWLLGPFLLAAFLIIVVYPLHTWLVRKGVPKILALGALLVTIFAVLVGLLATVLFSLGRLASLLPDYADKAQSVLAGIRSTLADLGIDPPQLSEFLSGIDVASVVGWLTRQIPPAVSAVTTLGFIAAVMLLLGIESTQIATRRVWIGADHPRLAEAVTRSFRNVRRFISVTTVFAVIVGVCDVIFLSLLDIPLALLWGLLAAVCNYIPYVGFIVGMVPPALLALLLNGPQTMLLVIVVYILLNFVITSLIPLKVVGDTVGLAMTTQLVGIAFWSWVFGPLGAILAVPLTLVTKAIFIDADPRARWLDGFLSSNKQITRQLREDGDL